jgi:hypothetical protein
MAAVAIYGPYDDVVTAVPKNPGHIAYVLLDSADIRRV